MRLSTLLCAAALGAYGLAEEIFYDTTWAGPIRIAERFNGTAGGFDRVEATLVMPQLSIPEKPNKQSDEYTAAFWIGFGGFLSSSTVSGLWQAGIIMSIWNNGSTEYKGFYEWVPNDPILLNSTELDISVGDHLQVILTTADNGMYGSVFMTNVNTSQTFSYSQAAPTAWRGPTFPALGNTAEWIMEAGTYINGPQYVFPDWHNATFLAAKACYSADDACFSPVSGENITLNAMTAVYRNDTETLYTKSLVQDEIVTIEYIEHPGIMS
ncbi:concanavalin A-like lectin/glucanase domain-containing protein [Truncatella angustata]|uniref:Concanavalin A-like lectin/glucanase domain-containing protein n=1 Tax=Truncatella angustata TaxID=152316 RepID=A0A9P8RLF3_9PEZI|nr:concanavalin A-like lectin/glucanase domain-containing protein [Truncatella angustata]KAH6646231.1 concanavalin A-like lectin/glucanase domain-containing protein [Truncatella angustata]KAH8203962.1 hypothetical protein TruAng_001904 [Truncatella angustata]